MMNAAFKERLSALEWLLLIVFTGMLAFHTIPRAWKTLNTDFPNYYLAASLVRDHVNPSRAYEWIWFQRQKDHSAIDQPLVGLAPITPFSTFAVLPFTSLRPLAAKHAWLLLQTCLLLALLPLLREVTGQSLRRIAMLAVMCFPLHRNLLYGQFYILLLVILTGACWAAQRGRGKLAGLLIGLAAACKIFPAIFLFYFVRKRNWEALGTAIVTLLAASVISVASFGWPLHRTYLLQVLPWTLRGEALPPYTLASGSLSTLLHRLFIPEPEWNPHPWFACPALFAILHPLLQTLLLAPALLLIRPGAKDNRRIALEWSGLLTATLVISTSPASYLFLLMILPMAVLLQHFRSPGMRVASFLLFLGIGYPGWHTGATEGFHILLHFPRLWLLVFFLALVYVALGTRMMRFAPLRREAVPWGIGLAVAVAVGILSGLHHVHGLPEDNVFRIRESGDALLLTAPHGDPKSFVAIAMAPNGYRLLSTADIRTDTAHDSVAVATAGSIGWVEQAGQTSRLIPFSTFGQTLFKTVEDAEAPALSSDGRQLAFIREMHGRGQLFLRTYKAETGAIALERRLSPASADVFSAAFLPDGSLLYAASVADAPTRIFKTGDADPLPLGEARFPAVSPDGRWLAYSRFDAGIWNLRLLDLGTGQNHAVAEATCNQVDPSWESDSHTLLYASDCNRALGFTALYRRRVLP